MKKIVILMLIFTTIITCKIHGTSIKTDTSSYYDPIVRFDDQTPYNTMNIRYLDQGEDSIDAYIMPSATEYPIMDFTYTQTKDAEGKVTGGTIACHFTVWDPHSPPNTWESWNITIPYTVSPHTEDIENKIFPGNATLEKYTGTRIWAVTDIEGESLTDEDIMPSFVHFEFTPYSGIKGVCSRIWNSTESGSRI